MQKFVTIPLSGCLSFADIAALTEHQERVFAMFRETMEQTCTRRGIEPSSRLHKAAITKAAQSAAEWLAKNIPQHYHYAKGVAS